ncbi:MAG: DUF2605 domain-containing protein [Cyanobacteria bacterium P01_F01_bin.53]
MSFPIDPIEPEPIEPNPREDPIEPKPSGDGHLPEDANLLKTVLPSLLDDFRYWFARTITLLESQEIGFLSASQQQDLLSRVQSAQQQVSASQALSAATDSQAIIDMSVVMSWHKLVHECWGVAIRYRKESAGQESTGQESVGQNSAGKEPLENSGDADLPKEPLDLPKSTD